MKATTRRTIWIILLSILVLLLAGCNSHKNSHEDYDYEYDYDDEYEEYYDDDYYYEDEYEYDYEDNYIDYQSFNGAMMSTPDSSCFSEIGYDSNSNILKVRFRDSGSAYLYYDFPPYEWENFLNANSLGSYYNSYIKGIYGPAERVD